MGVPNQLNGPSQTSQQSKEYDVFISYRRRNRIHKDWVEIELIPRLRKANLKVFDPQRVFPGENWTEALQRSIDSSRVFLPVYTSDLFNSDTAAKEFEYAMEQASYDALIEVIPIGLLTRIGAPYIGTPYLDFTGMDSQHLAANEIEEKWKELIDRIRKAIRKQRNQEKKAKSRRNEIDNKALKIDDVIQKTSSTNVNILTTSIPSGEQFGTPTVTQEGPATTLPSSEDELEVKGSALSDTYSEVDLLGYEDYVQALGDFIESPKTQKPLVLGIDAPWGGGKTSLMHMLEKRLGPQPIPGKRHFWQRKTTESFFTVWFNAWQYDQEESLWAALVLEILQQVRKQLGGWRRIKLSACMNWKRFDKPAFFADLGNSLLFAFVLTTAGFAAFAGLALILGMDWAETITWLKHYTKVLAGLGLVSLLYTAFKDVLGMLVSPFNLGISKYLKTPKYKDKVGFLGQFQNDFKDVVEVVTSKGKWPLVIFIDDLDRCTPGKAAAVIEAINLLLDSEHCVFIIGMDAHVLASSIQAKYKDLQEFFCEPDNPGGLSLGRKFLEKIIQIDFHIPRPDPQHVYDFIDANLGCSSTAPAKEPPVNPAESALLAEQRSGKSLEEARIAVQQNQPELASQLAEAVKAIRARSFDDDPEVRKTVREAAPYLYYNPRKIKRYINLFRLQALIAYRRGVLENTVSLDILGRWIIVNLRWPEFFVQAVERSEFVAAYFDIANKYEKATLTGRKKILDGVTNSSVDQAQIKQLIGNQDLYRLLKEIPHSQEDVMNYLQLLQASNSTTGKEEA